MAGVEHQADAATSADLNPAALDLDATHLTGRVRAFLMELAGYRDDIARLHDERAQRVIEALDMTLATPARPGTLRHVEQAASELLRALCAVGDASSRR